MYVRSSWWRTLSRSLGHGDRAGPRQYPLGSGTSGPGRAGWLPGGKQCCWCSKETRPRRSHLPLLPGENGKKKWFQGGVRAARCNVQRDA